MSTRRIVLSFTALMLSLSLGLGGCACSSNQQSSQSQQQTTQTSSTQQSDGGSATSEAATSQTVGESVSVTFNNQTGYDLSSLALRAAGAAEYDGSYTFDGIQIQNGSSTNVTFKEILQDGKAVEKYDILLKTTEDSYIEIFDVDVLGVKDLTLKFENGVGYIEYKADESDEVQSNQEEAEQTILENTSDVETYDQQSQLG